MYNLKGKTLIFKRWDTLESLQYDFNNPNYIEYKNLQPKFENQSHVFSYDGAKTNLMLFDREYKGLVENGYYIGEFWVYILKQ